MDPSELIEAFSETDVSAQTAGSYPPRLAAAEVAGTSSASSSAHAAAATGSSAPLTAADLGWNDLASSRLESNLDVQAATATARGGAVDLFLASPSQHYGWEALDVVLSLAARRDPPSVLSLSFGGRSGRAPAFRATAVPTTARRVRATKAPTKSGGGARRRDASLGDWRRGRHAPAWVRLGAGLERTQAGGVREQYRGHRGHRGRGTRLVREARRRHLGKRGEDDRFRPGLRVGVRARHRGREQAAAFVREASQRVGHVRARGHGVRETGFARGDCRRRVGG